MPRKFFFRKENKEQIGLVSGLVTGSIASSIYVNNDKFLKTESLDQKILYSFLGGVAGAGLGWTAVTLFPEIQIFLGVPIAVEMIIDKLMK